jgi:hypothetical protein
VVLNVVSSILTIYPSQFKLFFMNYKKKKKLFQQLSFSKIQKNSNCIMCFQANIINSSNRILLTKELNKLNFKLQIYQTKLLRQKKFIFEEIFTKNVYSGLFLTVSTNCTNQIYNIRNFFAISKNFTFLLPVCVIVLNRLLFNKQLNKISQFSNINLLLTFILLLRSMIFLKILKLKLSL